MTAVIPNIKVFLKKTQLINRPGMASRVAVVGAFDSLETAPQLFATVGEAQDTFGTDTTYNGCAVVPYLFRGASSLLAVNVTTESSGTRDKTITTTKLTDALAKIKGEDWDILFIAEPLTDTFIPIIDSFVEDCFEMKYPCGYIGALTGATVSANVTSAGLVDDFCYGLITQQFTLDDGTQLSVLLSSAYYCGLVAGMNVGNTMTMKTVDGVIGVSPELSFETGGDGKAYLEAGITTVKCADRNNNRYIVVNSEQPNGLDLYINRTRDFIVKQFALHEFLGERNNNATLDEIKQECDRVKELCVDTLDLLQDIQYSVVKKTSSCVDIYIDSLVFAGIITEIDVYVKLEVE